MNKKSTTRTRGNSGDKAETSEADNVDKIRDILFGNQMREMDQRFADLEKGLSRDLAALRKENALQIESLKTFVESEIEILGAKLGAEEKARIDTGDELEARLRQQLKALDKNLDALGKRLDESARDINQRLLRQSQDFSSELANQLGETRERMDEYRQALNAAKVDKQALSELLNGLALQVSGEQS